MKTTAKPAGPVHFDKVTRRIAELVEPYREICDLTDNEFPVDAEDQHGELIADAFNVHHETGLTPREILAQRDGLSDSLQREIAVNKCILTLIEQAYDRFTDNDMVPPNHALEKWLAKARVCMTHAASTESRAAIQNASKGGEA